MLFRVTIRETLVRATKIEAPDAWEAEAVVRSQYDRGEIILTADDFSDMEIEVNEGGTEDES